MTIRDDAKKTIAHVERQRKRIEAALANVDGETPEAWGLRVRKAFGTLIEEALPEGLPRQPSQPGDHPGCSDYAALNYTLAAEFVRVFPERQTESEATAISRGMVLDIWDMWWRRAGGIAPGEESRSPASQMGKSTLGTGHIIDPMVLRSVFSALDDDLARIFSNGASHANEEYLHDHAIWLLKRLHHTHFPSHERVVLYEFLRLRHWRQADRSIGLPARSIEPVISAAQETKKSLKSQGKKPMPTASEDAFGEVFDPARQDAVLMLETLQVLRSLALGPKVSFSEVGERLIEAAKQLGIGTADLSDADMIALIRRLAARSRMIRALSREILDYDFPEPVPFEPQDMPASAFCDCWISVIGHRQTGKTTFMRSLVAALMPDDARFDDSSTDWMSSRARILGKDKFDDTPKYSEIFKTKSMKDHFKNEMARWLAGDEAEKEEKEKGSTTVSNTIAEVCTPHMARLRFFDLAGEDIFTDRWGEMKQETRDMILARRPVATIYMDSQDERSQGQQRNQYGLAVEDAFTTKGPVYIVFNKADQIRSKYHKDAQAEIDRSIGYGGTPDVPDECDADYDPNSSGALGSVFSTRRLRLPKDGNVTHFDVLACIDEHPGIVRRPFFHDRIREDVQAVKELLDTLLGKGHRDISFVYLVSARDGRIKPSELASTRQLWTDLENRVLTSTRNDRRASLRDLLETGPVERLESAREAFARFDALVEPKNVEAMDGDARKIPERQDSVEPVDTWTKEFAALASLESSFSPIGQVIAEGKRVMGQTKKVERLKSLLDLSIGDFLPELGFLPETRKSEIEAAALIPAINPKEEQEFKSKAEQIAGQVQEWLTNKEVACDVDRVPALVNSMLMQSLGYGHVGHLESRTKAGSRRFHFDNGALAPVGCAAGSPIHDGDIRVAGQDVIRRQAVKVVVNEGDASRGAVGDWSFLEGLLATDIGREEKKALAAALCNFCAPREARYPELILRKGDLDFYRTRVLTNKDQLEPHLAEYRENALDVLDRLLTLRDWSHKLDLVTALNLAIARTIYAVLNDRQLPPIEKLENGEEGLVQELRKFCDAASQLANEIEHCRINEKSTSISDMLRQPLKPFRSRAAIYSDLYQSGERGSVWLRLDPTTHDTVNKGKLERKDVYEIRGATKRIKARVRLYELLYRAVSQLHGKEEIRKRAEQFIGISTNGIDVELVTLLCRLHVRRMYLVSVYPLLYLDMAQWLGDTTTTDRIKGSTNPKALQSLNEGAVEVKEKFDRALKERMALTHARGPTVGAPLGSAQEAWERAETERREFVRLLLDEQFTLDTVWGQPP